MAGLWFVDDDGERLALGADEAEALWTLARGFEAATVSACPDCRSRVLAVVALADLLAAGPPHPRREALLEFADECPTLHCYLVDADTRCTHRRWLDPGREEWEDGTGPTPAPPRRP